MPKPKASPPNPANLKEWLAFHVVNDWPTLQKAPIGVAALVSLSVGVAFLVLWFLFAQGVVSAKNATIESKQATIDTLKERLGVVESGAKSNPVLSSIGNPNAEKIIPLNKNLPAIDYDKTGVLWQWSVTEQAWH